VLQIFVRLHSGFFVIRGRQVLRKQNRLAREHAQSVQGCQPEEKTVSTWPCHCHFLQCATMTDVAQKRPSGGGDEEESKVLLRLPPPRNAAHTADFFFFCYKPNTQRRRKTRWGDEDAKVSIPGVPTSLPSNMSSAEQESFVGTWLRGARRRSDLGLFFFFW